jgi:DNA end-binding protein Ku
MAQTLIDSLSEKWNPADYHDSYREHVEALLKEKQARHEGISHAESDRGGTVIDLLEALQASVKNQSKATAAKKNAATKKNAVPRLPAAQKTPAKKTTTKASPSTKSARASTRAAPRRKAS